MSDRIAVVSNGKPAQVATPSEIYYHPASRFVADFIGESNFFVGTVTDKADGEATIEIPGCVRPVRVPCNQVINPGQQFTAMVRPERIKVSTTEPDSTSNVSKGIVTKDSFMGMYTQLYVEMGETLTKIFSPNETETEANWTNRLEQPVYLSWNPPDSNLLLM